jgi:glycosyltransferase involved in cell wall biosynthesis
MGASGRPPFPKPPEVSVIIPTYNRCWRLSRTMTSALSQTGVAIELLIVDDGSTDGTRALLVSMSDRRIRVIRNPSRRGVAAARNIGIRAARGRWIALLDDDDLWSPGKLSAQLDAADRQGRAWTFSSVVMVDDAYRLAEVFRVEAAPALADVLRRSAVVPAGASNVCVRAEAFRAVGGFDERFTQLADWDMWIRLLAAFEPAICPELHVAYIYHRDNMISSGASDVLYEARMLLQKHADTYAQHGCMFDWLALYNWIASGQLRAGRRVAAARLLLRAAVREMAPRNVLRASLALLGEPAWRAAKRRLIMRDEGRPDWLQWYDIAAPAPGAPTGCYAPKDFE